MKKFRELEKYSTLNPIRDHIKLQFNTVEPGKELEEIIEYLKANLNPATSRAIIFCTSRKATEEAAHDVNGKFGDHDELAGNAGYYHAGLDSETRERTFNQYKNGSLTILFATKAFGMGMDIPNIHHVYHMGPSSSFEDYLQEVGRAGRNQEDLKKAGFSKDNPIQAICCFSKDSFPSSRDRIQKTQISWNDLCNVYEVYKEYRSQFIVGNEKRLEKEYLPIPLNILTTSLKYMDADTDLSSLFRLSLYWLQQADRIHSRYFVPAYLEFENESFVVSNKNEILDDDLKGLYEYIYSVYEKDFEGTEYTLVDSNKLLKTFQINRDEMFMRILKAQKKGYLKLANKLNVKQTSYVKHDVEIGKLGGLNQFQFLEAVLEASSTILSLVKENEKTEIANNKLQEIIREIEDEVLFEGFINKVSSGASREFLKQFLKSSNLNELKRKNKGFKKEVNFIKAKNPDLYEILKSQKNILRSNKSSSILKSAFFLLNLHPRINITSKFSEENNTIIQIVQLETEKKALTMFSRKFCEDARALLEELQKATSRIIDVNELILKLPLSDPKYSEVENLFFLLRKLGYIRFPGGLVPMAIEMKFDNLTDLGELPEDENLRKVYEETLRMKKLRLIVLESFSELKDSDDQSNFIQEYFSNKDSIEVIRLIENYSKRSDELLASYRSEALKERFEELNDKQKEVYQEGIRNNISVLAGPGTGKTHTLVLRVARLIQEENIPPNKILVLAYNRAVVEELKIRLKSLFMELGYKRLIDSLQIYTFSALTGSVLKQSGINEDDLNAWEDTFLDLYKGRGRNILGKFSDVEYVFIDEFQDITNKRLEILKIVAPDFRTYITAIGDPNQSIYGYERVNENGSRGPEAYYDLFRKEYRPIEKELIINYRSNPSIIEASLKVLSDNAVTIPLRANPDIEEHKGEIEIYNQIGDYKWLHKFYKLISNKVSNEIAILFRSNDDLYKEYTLLKNLTEPLGYKIEIKGSATSFIKQREIAYVLERIMARAADRIHENEIPDYIKKIKDRHALWHQETLDDLNHLFEYYYKNYNEDSTYGDFIHFVEEITAKDDGQLFKILKRKKNIIIPTVILTTIHRVKGMEYESVIVPSSRASLPFDPNRNGYTLNEFEEIIEEEKRLRYVAYSRAKKYLIVALDEREKCIENKTEFRSDQNGDRGIPVKSGENNTVISWKAGNHPFFQEIHDNIHTSLTKGIELSIKIDQFGNYGLWNDDIMVEKFMSNYSRRFNGGVLDGVHVDSVVRYTAEDCQRYDEKHNSRYYQRWSNTAKKRGYIYLVNFFGYALEKERIKEIQQEIIDKIRSI